MKSIVAFVIEPFGSKWVLLLLAAVFVLVMAIDMASTYRLVREPDVNFGHGPQSVAAREYYNLTHETEMHFERESNVLARLAFENFDFFAGATITVVGMLVFYVGAIAGVFLAFRIFGLVLVGRAVVLGAFVLQNVSHLSAAYTNMDFSGDYMVQVRDIVALAHDAVWVGVIPALLLCWVLGMLNILKPRVQHENPPA